MIKPSTCIICGAQFQPRSTRGLQKYCSDKCKKIAANRMMTASRNKKRKQELAHKKASKALAEFAREARDNGMTYGQYMAYLQRKKELGDMQP